MTLHAQITMPDSQQFPYKLCLIKWLISYQRYLLIMWMFQGYRCESGIVTFPWKVTWNYGYSRPFKVWNLKGNKTLTLLQGWGEKAQFSIFPPSICQPGQKEGFKFEILWKMFQIFDKYWSKGGWCLQGQD